MKHSALVLAWCTYPQENPFFILFPCLSKSSAPALCVPHQWVVFCVPRKGELSSIAALVWVSTPREFTLLESLFCVGHELDWWWAGGVCLAKPWARTPSRHEAYFLLSVSFEQTKCVLCAYTACLEMEADPCLGPVDPLGWDLTGKKLGLIFWFPLQLWSCSPEICVNQFEGTVKIKTVILWFFWFGWL